MTQGQKRGDGRYPANWEAISAAVRKASGNRCECTGECGECADRCSARNGHSHGTTKKVVLTVAHVDGDRANNDRANLLALCQGCHSRLDRAQHEETRKERKRPLGDVEIPVIEEMSISDLKLAGYNPRKITPRALAGLRESMERFGLVQPIVVNRANNVVVSGHQRLKLLRESGMDRIPCVIVDLDERNEKLLNITMNNPDIAGEFTDLSDLAGIVTEDERAALVLEELFPAPAVQFEEAVVWEDAPVVPVGLIFRLEVPHTDRARVESLIHSEYPGAVVKIEYIDEG